MCYFRTCVFFILFSVFLDYTVANSLRDPYICGQPSCIKSQKFSYRQSVIYQYDYNITVNTWFARASENQSVLYIRAGINLEFITECEGLLKITSVKMKDQDEEFIEEREETFSNELVAHPLRFAFHDGVITELCPQEEEMDWTLNFKRGILSAFQNTMDRFDIDYKGIERDIHGTCNTEYQMQGQQNSSLIVLKNKDLTQCQDRYKYLSILQTVRYHFQSKYQTWPVLQSESRCRIEIDFRVYTRVDCRERHIFEPFSGKQSGAMTTVVQNIKLTQELNKTSSEILDEKKEEWEPIKHRYSLLHYHSSIARAGTGELKSARDMLKQLCKAEEEESDGDSESQEEGEGKGIKNTRGGETVTLWGGFVRACRTLHHPALAQLLNRANSICPQARKHVLDALPYIASVGSVELIKEMIIAETAGTDTREDWLMSMAMIPRPQREMIVSMQQLLEHSPKDKAISLAASSMVHSYCRNSKKSLSECCLEEQNMAIIELLQNNILRMLADGNTTLSREIKDMISVSIKSLANIGGFTKDFADRLMSLIEDPLIPLSIRIHAVDAFRRTPCFETREYFLELFRQQRVDVEIRLASYLQVMRCPKYDTIRAIIQTLQTETINQVASFVWSHLRNLDKSTIPSRVEKQGLLSGNTIPRPKHQPDVRKFSRNYEHGVFFDQYNAGANYEANLIMSPDSYIPRSASLNLTVDMFGESINILELNIRNEGFEKYIEDIFGNNGPFSKSKIDEKLRSLRIMRSANEADEIEDKINSIPYENEGLNHRKPILDLGMKVFGNEISYWSVEGDDEIMDGVTKLNPLYHIKKILSGKEISYKKSSLFLDTTYSVPTGCGLPMTMNLMGTNVVNLKLSGSITGADNFLETKDLGFEGKIHPSMALNIAATMSVAGSGLGSTGIRLNVRLHTATAVSTEFNIKKGKTAALKLSLPHSKQEIFQAKSELIVLHGPREIKQMGISKNKVEVSTCSWKALDYAIGIKLCATYEFPNVTDVSNAPYFLMAGPARYLLSLEKVDPSAKVYSFVYTWDSNDTTKHFGFSFDTPGSKTHRMFNSSITLLSDSGTAELAYHASNNYLKAHAKYSNRQDHKSVECVLDIDGQKHFDAIMSLDKQDRKNGYVYIPRFYVAVNNEKITELAGTLKMAQKKGVSQCDVSLHFQTKRLASRLIGYLTWNGPSKGAKLRLDYQFLGERKETAKIESVFSRRELGQRMDLYGELGLEFTSYPHLNFFTVGKYMGTINHVECNMNLSSSRETSNNPKIHYSLARHRTIEGFKLHHHLKLLKPYLDIHYKTEEVGSLSTVNVTVEYDRSRSTQGSIMAITGRWYAPSGVRLFLDAALNVTLPSMTPMLLDIRLHEKRTSEYDISAQGVWFTGSDASVVALFQDQSTAQLASRRLKAIVTGTHFREVAIDAKYTQDNRQLNFNLKGEQGTDHYSFLGRYILYSEKNISCYGQLDIASKTYSLSLLADLYNDSNVLADIHLDQLRDIHITYTKINRPHVKRLNADVNWDSNRDPNQKVSLAMELLNKGPLNLGGSFLLFYPGRLINGEFDFLFKDWLCQWLVKLGWSPDDIILWKVKVFSQMERETIYALLSEMDTPFQGWRDTSLNLIWRYVDNLQSVSGNMTWENERLVFGLQGDYMLKTNEVYGEFSGLVNSTLAALPKIAAVAKHHHLWRKSADTLLSFDYNNDGLMMLNSSWKIDKSANSHNISGRVGLKSPFQGYKTGLLVTKFMFNQKRDVQGLTHLDLEEKIYTITVDGHVRRFTNSMLVFNITTPTPTGTLISGRFGFMDVDHHAVAMLETPNMTVGVELLLHLNSVKNFHIYGHVALPIEFLHDAMVMAKRSSEEVNFRLGWEKYILGFTYIWHYNTIVDFQYLYKLFTPLKGFEENGLVLKNLYNGNGLDSEASIRLSKLKMGIAFLVRDNGKGLLKIIEEKYMGIVNEDFDQIFEDFSSDVYATIDTLYYPTVTFDAQLTKYNGHSDEEIIKILANLHLHNMSAITLKNKFIIEDLTNMWNDLHLTTPYSQLSEVKFYHTFEAILDERYNITFLLLTKNTTEWTENSLKLFYEHNIGVDEEYSTRTGNIALISQLEPLKYLNAKLQIHVDASLTRIDANIDMPSCQLAAKGQVEMEETFADISGSMNLTSPYVQPYGVRLEFKKDFSDVENTVVCGLQVKQGTQNNFLFSEVSWRAVITDQLRAKVRISLSPVIPPTEVALALSKTDAYSVIRSEARVGSKDNLYTVVAEQRQAFTTVAVTTPHKGFRNMNLTGEVRGNDVTGVFRNDALTFNIAGKIISRNPFELTATVRPVKGGDTYTVRVKTTESKEKFGLTASLIGAIQFTLYINSVFGNRYREFSAKIDSSHQYVKGMFVRSRVEMTEDKRVLFNLEAGTPLQNLKTLSADADISLTPKLGAMICQYNMTNLSGENDIRWSFKADDTYFKIRSYQLADKETRSLDINTFHFQNETLGKKSNGYFTTGFYINLDDAWKCGSNTSFSNIGKNKINLNLNVLLPPPNIDVHSFNIDYEDENETKKSVKAKYNSDVSKYILLLTGKVSHPNGSVEGNLGVDWGKDDSLQKVENVVKLNLTGNVLDVDYALLSPLFKDQDTFQLKGSYSKPTEELITLVGTLSYPETAKLIDVDLVYGGLKYTIGTINTTTPFDPFPWVLLDARIANGDTLCENIIEMFWPNHSAFLNSTLKYSRDADNAVSQKGVVSLEVPLSTVHMLVSEYSYVQGDKWSNGENLILYNGEKLIRGQFQSISDIGERDLQRNTVNMSFDAVNISPWGVHYIHQYDEQGDTDIKQASVYEINNPENFNLTGRLDIEPWNSGKQVKILAIQGNKTIRFENNYELKEKELFQGSKFQWTPDVWLHYDINILNKTEAEDECQELKVSLKYPSRSLNVLSSYHLQEFLLSGWADIDWSLGDDNRTVRLEGEWKNPDLPDNTLHDVKLSLMHPSFSKDVTLHGKYISDASMASNMSVVLEYSDYEEDRLIFNSFLKDNSNGPIRDYKFELDCKHPATNLDLVVRTDINMYYKLYHIKNFYSYQKTLFHQTVKQGEILIDWNNRTIHYVRTSDREWYKMNATWLAAAPEYKVLVKVNRTTGNDNGIWLLSTKDKSILAHFNKSDDVSFHLIGRIKDARSADLSAWRDFDDVTTVDASWYVHLNHSRLLTSQLLWRPEIYQEMKSWFATSLREFYHQNTEILQIWKSIPMETLDIMKNVWTECKPKIRDFLNDLNDLHVIKDDLEEFQRFLSESYDENNFYAKDITEFVVHIIDQLALKSHIENIPNIVNEVWQVLGDTGKSLRESITWIIEAVKSSYARLVEKVNAILEADIMEQVSNLLEMGILEYDSFMKNLHLKFINYVESTWRNIVERLSVFWRSVLKAMEPTFLRVIHYLETFIWNVGKEVGKFFHERTSEITESPYFYYLTSSTHELDKILKDMINNDAVTNIKKYTKIFVSYINEKILVHIPFRKELQEIVSEIWSELKKLQELNLFQFAKAKFWETKMKMEWWYNYFKIGDVLDVVTNALYKKITELPKTALQNEEAYRKAKTNFIFDPRKGQLLLEQKLPVPWHAFNRTPNFSEISEYRILHNFMDNWILSNHTIMSYYYEYKPYTDLYNLLPPFFGTAVMTGHGTIVTLDKKVFTLTGTGIFLLTRDFLGGNFTLLLEGNTPGKYNLVLFTKTSLIRIDLFEKSVEVGDSVMMSLPSRVDQWIVERDENIMHITHDQGVTIQCDFHFKTCKVKIDGWYYARLGGLFGTMNNEPSDDLIMPQRQIASSLEELFNSWKLMESKNPSAANAEKFLENETVCEAYFRSKVSPLKACFPMINVAPFYYECMTGLDPCILANAYMEVCLADHIPIRTPEKCMECVSPDGKPIDEGTFNFVVDVPNSTDVVFIIETHACNVNIRKAKNIDFLVTTLDDKLKENGLTDNRYTVVGYGHPGKYSSAYSLYYKNQLFVNASELSAVLDRLEFTSEAFSNSSNYTSDAFHALSLSSRLSFRPGVSKTFFLFPCTKCIDYAVQLDYTVVHQVLTDSSVTLHIVMNSDFIMSKKRISKQLFGIDNYLAYTVKDTRELSGDSQLRQQVKLPKTQLGFCASLSMETNGTIFAGTKLKPTEPGGGKRAASVLSARAAHASRPCSRARCECHSTTLRCTACPRHLSRNPMSDLSLSMWDSAEMEDFIDNFLDTSVPTI